MKKCVSVAAILIAILFVISATANAQDYTWATAGAWEAGLGVGVGTDVQGGFLSNALGAPDNDFVRLGMEGAAVFDFGVEFDSAAIVFETTWGGRMTSWKEFADVYVADSSFAFSAQSDPGGNADILSYLSDFTYVGSINNAEESSLLNFVGGPFRYVLIVDTTRENNGTIGCGYDVNAVGVVPSQVPEPITLILFGLGLAGLATLRRKS